ncbi:MAG: trypsin-like peptidase domain-containing protein [Candidatus Riflebacteria bacterium]|nr:trypsin-like peptidase domain-containing protein [Candidatus Riflebacteria bacterium]
MSGNGCVQIIASSIHAGVACPACGEAISEGANISVCNKCGGIHHHECWFERGCSTYHCSPDKKAVQTIIPDIVIKNSDLSNIRTTPKGRIQNSERIAGEIETKLKRTSVLSIICMLAGSLFMVFSVIMLIKPADQIWNAAPLLISVLGGLLTVIIGAISVARIHGNPVLKGVLFSTIGIVTGSAALFLSFFGFVSQSSDFSSENMSPVQFNPEQIKGFIEKASDKIRNPLKCNVHISSPNTFLGEAQGSGVCLKTIGKNVYILSNLHVITAGKKASDLKVLQNAKKILVTFFNGDRKLAEPIWIAPSDIDLILIKTVAPEKLDLSSKISSDRLPGIGDKVFAIGNPMGLNWSYTDGVVSAIRQQLFGKHEVSVIQMQTPLNPGNSGGGLYDQDGYLVGINTWIYTKTVSEGLNFSISMNGISQIMDPSIRKLLSLSDSTESVSGEKYDSTPEAPASRSSKNN